MDARRQLNYPHVAVGALIEKGGKILLVHEYCPDHPDHEKWHIPAGWAELGEDPVGGIIREVQEEAGYAFLPTSLLGVYSMARKELDGAFAEVGGYWTREGYPHGFRIIYLGQISGEQGEFWTHEISETRWFAPEEIEAMDDVTLRDRDVKQMVKDYFAGKRYPLETITHTVRDH